ncbi:MAG: Crp/Fnr family transcriptional regulator [Chloroflexi bacterium]|jgi:CRP/FNR family transcriptional regulator|nr:Crp/Fnr family transcriptional regulator [Chloroflexota bacterium]
MVHTPTATRGSRDAAGASPADASSAPAPLAAFGGMASLVSAAGRTLLQRHARPFHAGPSLFRQEGDPCDAITLLAGGRLRVAKRHASGREITLYLVEPGDLCVLEVLAVLAGAPYAAEAVIEEPASGVSVPGPVFRELVDTEAALRASLFRSIEARMSLALDLVGDVALGRLEARLASAVLRHAGASAVATVTHERLAQELACAREAVSRALGGWERAGIVRLGRGSLTVLDAGRLAALAEPSPP